MLKKLSTANIKQKEETTLKKTSQDSETAQQLFVQNENHGLGLYLGVSHVDGPWSWGLIYELDQVHLACRTQ